MSISDLAGAAELTPAAQTAVAIASVKAAVLTGLQTGDTGLAGVLGHLSNEGVTAVRLLHSLASGVGRNVDAHA